MKRIGATVLASSLALCAVAVRTRPIRAADDEASVMAETDARILNEIHEHSELMENLEYLSDRIGPRLTGSPLLKEANDWTAEMFRRYGPMRSDKYSRFSISSLCS